MIANVEDDTPASDAGVRPGDVVLSFGGVEITGVPQFRRVVAGFGPDETVAIDVIRDGDRKTLSATLAERPGEVAAAEDEPAEEDEKVWFGLRVVGLDDPVARELGIDAEEGVLVVDVESGGPGADGGMQMGDVVVKIDDREITDLAEYRSVMRGLEGQDKAIAVMVRRGAYTYFVAIKPEK
jgi:serine protease Do